MKGYKKRNNRVLSIILSAVMVCTALPSTVLAKEGDIPIGTGDIGTIQSFERLEERFIPSTGKDAPSHIYTLPVALNTPVTDLSLPDELRVMVERTITVTNPETESKDSDSTDEESKDSDSTVEESKDPDSTVEESKDSDSTVEESKDPDSTVEESKDSDSTVEESKDSDSTVEESKDSDSTIEESKDSDSTVEESKDSDEKKEEAASGIVSRNLSTFSKDAGNTIKPVDNDAEIFSAVELEQTKETIETIPVTWNSNKKYSSGKNGKFIYTAKLPEGYILADGVKLPQIYVMVGIQGRAAAATEGLLAGRYDHTQVYDCQISGGSEITVEQLYAPLGEDNMPVTTSGYIFYFEQDSTDNTVFSLWKESASSPSSPTRVFEKGKVTKVAEEGFIYLGMSDNYMELGWFISNGGPINVNTTPSVTYTVSNPGPLTHEEAAAYNANTVPGDILKSRITFNANGGSVNPTRSMVNADGTLASLPTPTRDSYRFEGWFTAADGGEEVTTDTVFNESVSIFAHWTYIDSTGNNIITFNANGGSVTPASATTGTDGKLAALPTPTHSGSYRFDGWFTAADGGEEVTTDTVFNESVSIFAHWTYIDSTGNNIITFNANGGNVTPASATTGTDGKLAALPTPTRSGSYRFDGWFTEASGGTAVTTATVFTVNGTIYAHWTYTGRDVGDSSSSSNNSTYYASLPENYKGKTKIIGNVQVPDYTVEGTWKINASGTWQFYNKNGVAYADNWIAAFNPYANVPKGQSAFDWFRFDAAGNMMTGWFTDELGDTFYLNPIGDNTRGAMAVGWRIIDGKYYYFNTKPDGTRGKLLKETKTPDGYYVDKNGSWDGKEK